MIIISYNFSYYFQVVGGSMKYKNALMFFAVMSLSAVLIVFSKSARTGAADGLALAQNTIIPSLLPLLIIFYFVMKSSCGDFISRYFGFVSQKLFNLPQVTFPAVLFGLIGGYPTGALLICELLENDNIDKKQARRMLRFNMCGGCGFIITAVGSAVYGSTQTGLILFASNVLSAVTVGIILSFTEKRENCRFYSFSQSRSLGDALNLATSGAVKAVLNITAYIVLFSAVNEIINLPEKIIPLIEITGGVCEKNEIPLPLLSAFLSFGGLCIHLQILPVILKADMSYFDFLIFRVINALISFFYTKVITMIFPVEKYVFSNTGETIPQFFSVNILLSVLLVLGCFVIVGDICSKSIVSERTKRKS